jgi:predicted RNA binding protein YcfA (HicA-like mRNA interferase family)
MAKLRPLKLRELLRVLSKAGFVFVSQSGSHAKYRHPDGRMTIVPIHAGEVIGRGFLREILKECKMSEEELLTLL